MDGSNDDEFSSQGTSAGFFHRSLSPRSFERLRTEHSDYFYKPKRGPSASKSNITITRPIKTFETVNKLMDLLSHRPKAKVPVDEMESPPLSKKFDDQRSSSHYSSFLSMDGGDLSSGSSSVFSSRSNSSISTVAEQETEVIVIEEPILPSKSIEEKPIFYFSSCHIPAIGINITTTNLHLVLLELYPQNVDASTITFQRYLISLMTEYEHKNWSILNVDLQTQCEQEANFRLFTLTPIEFDVLLTRLQSFIRYNVHLASTFVLNIALTGDQTNEYETKISSHLNKINLNFDIIQQRAESYMIGLEFFRNKISRSPDNDFMQCFNSNPSIPTTESFNYPYLLLHAEKNSTFFYIVYSSSKYSVLTSNNLCYQTYCNLMKMLQPGYDPSSIPSSSSSSSSSFSSISSSSSTSPMSFDTTFADLCKHYHRSSSSSSSSVADVPLTSFTRVPTRFIPADYSVSIKPHYIYRGWINRHTDPHHPQSSTYDVHTQTDDSFVQSSTISNSISMRRSLLSMFTMNIALMIKLLSQLHPSITSCLVTGEVFQIETQMPEELGLYLRSMMGASAIEICHLKREALISALGCALPRVYFDVIDDKYIRPGDCVH